MAGLKVESQRSANMHGQRKASGNVPFRINDPLTKVSVDDFLDVTHDSFCVMTINET